MFVVEPTLSTFWQLVVQTDSYGTKMLSMFPLEGYQTALGLRAHRKVLPSDLKVAHLSGAYRGKSNSDKIIALFKIKSIESWSTFTSLQMW